MKHIGLTFALLFSVLASQAQFNFMHAVGAGSYYSSQESTIALMYAPRLNFIEFGDETSLSVGSNLGFMYIFNSNDDRKNFAMDIPGLVQLNFGTAATPFSYAPFGGFIGGGFGYNSIGSASVFNNAATSSWGPVYTAGIRFRIGYTALEARVSYLQAINRSDAPNIIGIGGLYVFGEY